ncbi:MAG: hypothetical protein Q4C75_07670, partial [Bergeyella zoohelcum]|nr:hypothetical protein [Bergeyella zoohelcum]
INLAYAPSGIISDYDINKILYRLVKNPQGDYYEFSSDQSETLYQVSFTYFGNGKGDYRLKQTTNNGRVFEYVGAGLGDYSAVRKLPMPQASQVFSGNVEYALENGKVGADFSLSNYDINLFSSIDNHKNKGFAGRIFAQKTFQTKNWKGTPAFEFQHIGGRFHILDRINDVEFARDFNLAQEFSNRTQNRLIFSFLNQWSGRSFINYKMNYLSEQTTYKGLKNDLDFGWGKGKFQTKGNISYLSTDGEIQQTKFIRGNWQNELIGKKGSWVLGGSMEHNEKKIMQTQLYDTTSFSWKEIFAQKIIGDSTRTKLSAKIYFRDNDSIQNNRLENVNQILGFVAESNLIKTEKTQLSTLLHYRKFFNKNVNDNANQNFVIGNILYNQQLFRNGLRIQAFYELGNGQEAQREFQYIKVTDGQGVYKWTDYNGDGVQQIDEFETAEYLDLAQYIRVYTNTIRYLPSNKNKLQLAVFINPSSVLKSENQFLKRWNFNLSLLSQNSYFKGDKMLVANPFARETNQILKNQTFLATAQFHSTEVSGWNGNYRFSANNNIINANFSNEESLRKSHFLNLGYWFNKNLRADWENTFLAMENRSQLFATRNYNLQNIET